ncbi:MAG TPA: hypothetical protein VIL71_07760 [Spirillospora sp.]
MQTRYITLLTAAGAVAVAAGVAAASTSFGASSVPGPDGAGRPPGAVSPFAPEAGSSDATAPQSDGTTGRAGDAKDCRDANCEIEVEDGDTITLDEKNGVEAVRVDVDRDRVTFTIRSGDSYAVTTMDATSRHGVTSYNGIEFRPHRTEDGRIMLTISSP